MRLALRQVHDNNGLEGRTFSLLSCDNNPEFGDDITDQTEATIDIARWLASGAGVEAIVGPAASSRDGSAAKN